MRFCPMRYLEIRDVNLVSFTFRGATTNLVLENVSSVRNIDISISTCGLLYKLAPMITANFTQLVMLTLEGCHETTIRHFNGSFPTFKNLKRLMLRLYYVAGYSLLESTPLLEAAPYLQKFTIKLRRSNIKYVFDGEIRRKTPKSPHQHLSEVRYRGYFGDINDVELAMYLFENTLALEKFIVDPCVELQHNCEGTHRARDRAMLQLQPLFFYGNKCQFGLQLSLFDLFAVVSFLLGIFQK